MDKSIDGTGLPHIIHADSKTSGADYLYPIMEITIYVNEEELGPYTLKVVQSMLAKGEVSKEDWAWYEGGDDYVTVAEIPGIDETPASSETHLKIYIWSEDADDWEGEYSVGKIQEMLTAGEVKKSTFIAYEGAVEGATVADLPGIEIPKEKKPEVKKSGKLAPGTQKSTKSQRQSLQKGKGAVTGKTGKANLSKNKAQATTAKVIKTAGPLPRIIPGIMLLLALGLNVFVALNGPEMSLEFAQIVNPFASEPGSHALFHSYGLYAASGFCLLAAVFVFLAKGSIVVSLSGIVLLLIGIWGVVATFMGTTPLFLATGLGNLAVGLLSLITSKLCK
jgi:hypothetical protein